MGRRVIFQFSRLRLSDLFVPGSIIPLKCMGWAIMSRGEAKSCRKGEGLSKLSHQNMPESKLFA